MQPITGHTRTPATLGLAALLGADGGAFATLLDGALATVGEPEATVDAQGALDVDEAPDGEGDGSLSAAWLAVGERLAVAAQTAAEAGQTPTDPVADNAQPPVESAESATVDAEPALAASGPDTAGAHPLAAGARDAPSQAAESEAPSVPVEAAAAGRQGTGAEQGGDAAAAAEGLVDVARADETGSPAEPDAGAADAGAADAESPVRPQGDGPAEGVEAAEAPAQAAAAREAEPRRGAEAGPLATATRAKPATTVGEAERAGPQQFSTPASASGVGENVQTAPSTEPRVAPSGLAARIAEAAEMLENAPPPRRMTLEVGDLRLAVSLRGDNTVRVAVLGAPPSQGWDAELADGLAERGFELDDSGPGQQGRDRGQPPWEQPRPPAPNRPRPASRTAGWRL